MADGRFLGKEAMLITGHSRSAQNRRIPSKYLGRLFLSRFWQDRTRLIFMTTAFAVHMGKKKHVYAVTVIYAPKHSSMYTRSFHKVRHRARHTGLVVSWTYTGCYSLHGCLRRSSDWLKTPQENARQRRPSVSSRPGALPCLKIDRVRAVKRNNAASTPSNSHCFSRVRSITSRRLQHRIIFAVAAVLVFSCLLRAGSLQFYLVGATVSTNRRLHPAATESHAVEALRSPSGGCDNAATLQVRPITDQSKLAAASQPVASLSRRSCGRCILSARVMGWSAAAGVLAAAAAPAPPASAARASSGDEAAPRAGSCDCGCRRRPPTLAGGGAGGTSSSSPSVAEAEAARSAPPLAWALLLAAACLPLDTEPLRSDAADRCEACDRTEEPLARREQPWEESPGGASMP